MVLKTMMGHASITTTERYIHTTDNILRLNMEQAFEKIMAKEAKKT